MRPVFLMDLMGSSYLLAHGMGEPVEDAYTEVTFPETGTYYVYVRTYNWTSPWKDGEGPGKFSLSVGNKKMISPLGADGSAWMWQVAGKVSVKDRKTVLKLHDLTGFDGRLYIKRRRPPQICNPRRRYCRYHVEH